MRRETPPAQVVIATPETSTMRARCSCPLESVIQTVIPGVGRVPSFGGPVASVWAEAAVGESEAIMTTVSQICLTPM